MLKYKHLFFDWDNTLWDFSANSLESLFDVYNKFQLNKYFNEYSKFYTIFHYYNDILWQQYRNEEISKETLATTRFYKTLLETGYDNYEFSLQLNEFYLDISATKTHLLPNAEFILNYCKSENCQLHIITNGFNEVQYRKISASGLSKYFENIITSEDAGYLKPRAEFFEYAIKRANAAKNEILVIGDDYEADIKGALISGLDCVYYNYKNRKTKGAIPTYEISDLSELIKILQTI